jgi:UrcA family protein
MYRSLVLALVSAAALGVGYASAESLSVSSYDGARNAVTIRASAADLGSPSGAKALAERVRIAAGKVCGADDALARGGADFPACRQAAIDRALTGVDAPLLAAALGRPERLARQ